MSDRIRELMLLGSSEASVSNFLAQYEHDTAYCINVFPDNDPVAVIAYRLIDDCAEILDIAVESEHRGKGIGSRLIEQVVKTHSPRKILAETDDDAVGFYRKLGFVTTPFKSKWGTTRYSMELDCQS